MQTRSSVLGKRGHQDASANLPTTANGCDQLRTPDNSPNPKRPRTSVTVLDGDGNKENIPPLKLSPVNGDTSPRAIRALRRTATEVITPTRSRPRKFVSSDTRALLTSRLQHLDETRLWHLCLPRRPRRKNSNWPSQLHHQLRPLLCCPSTPGLVHSLDLLAITRRLKWPVATRSAPPS